MTVLHGFELVREGEVPELNTKARLWRHVRTGAELLSMVNDDENKVFGIAFRTPPTDSTGVPHIMEHAVLAGSRKYQVKEPFVELLKGSLYTFLNAFTAPDRTVYPVASTNLQDFYNLVDVYLDAVFFPLITPHHLDQEGWHYELESLDAPLVYKGVVFNEMKGAYSSPDGLVYRYGKQVLFPDTVYAHDSGGDPEVIPQLTYEQFKRFHEVHYHPSNAMIYFYGDDPEEERLRLLDGYLRDFERREVATAVSSQPSFSSPRRHTFPFPAEAQGANADKGIVHINWLLPENDDPELAMALQILSYALVGTQASPLRKRLIDSGLGEDLTSSGLSTYLRQMTFGVGLKGVRVAEDADRVEQLVLDTLEELAQEGIESDMIEAALNTIEFNLRENNTGRLPRGLVLMNRVLTYWVYGRNPFDVLGFEAPLTAVKSRLAADPAYLQTLIRRYLLANPHRVTLVLEPDPTLKQRLETAEKEKLAQIRSQMSQEELQAIIENTRALKQRQESPDPPEKLAAIPRLQLSDLDPEIKRIPLAISEAGNAPLLYHDLFTNGILYLDIGFNLQALPVELLPYVHLFGASLLKMGTETEDYVKLSQRIGRKTGGISTSYLASALRDREGTAVWMFLRGKATVPQAPELLAIIRDILLTVQLDNQERFRQIVLEAKARKEASLIPGGHGVIDRRLRAHFHSADWVSEQMGGINYLFFLRQLLEEIDNNWSAVHARLEQIRQALINQSNMLYNVTLDATNWQTLEPQIQTFATSFPVQPVTHHSWDHTISTTCEGLTIPAQVNYVGKGANLYQLGYKLHGSVAVITRYLRTTWLWERVRMSGGAYGSFCSFDRDTGVLTFLSYRDPNLLGTLNVYDQTADFLRRHDLTEDELTKGIIGAIGALDGYQLPDAKGYTSMVRYLIGSTDESRQKFRDEVLGTTAVHFREFADILDQVRQAGHIVVLGSADALTAANEQLQPPMKMIQVM
ncbi:MAG: peptidase M16 [Chloroflexi bacterium]|nr:MAG: peptidase M16 [Chloroflexota bacterium]